MDRTERDITFAQAEADYGTSDLRELNRLLANRAANATDGNGDQQAELIPGLPGCLRIVTIVY